MRAAHASVLREASPRCEGRSPWRSPSQWPTRQGHPAASHSERTNFVSVLQRAGGSAVMKCAAGPQPSGLTLRWERWGRRGCRRCCRLVIHDWLIGADYRLAFGFLGLLFLPASFVAIPHDDLLPGFGVPAVYTFSRVLRNGPICQSAYQSAGCVLRGRRRDQAKSTRRAEGNPM